MPVRDFARRWWSGVQIGLLDLAHGRTDHRAQGSHPGDETLGYGQPSALFAILVGDTAIALALLTLFTRVVVLTLILWVGGLIYRSLFGGGAAS